MIHYIYIYLLSDIGVANISSQSMACLFLCSKTSRHAPISVDIFSPLSNISCSHQIGFWLGFLKCRAHSMTSPVWMPGYLHPLGSLSSLSGSWTYSVHVCLPPDALFIFVLYIWMFCFTTWMLAPWGQGMLLIFSLVHLKQCCANILGILCVQVFQGRSPLNKRLWRRSSFSFFAQ